MKNKGGKPRHNLLGQRFEKLTIISQAPNIMSGKNKSQKSAWNCQCDCGKIVIVGASTLLGGKKSCGCHRNQYGRAIKPGEIFERLTTMAYNGDSSWTCRCQCGEISSVRTDKLMSGHTRSCGCLQKEIAAKNSTGNTWSRKYIDPNDDLAMDTWRGRYEELPFEDFYRISQLECYYCLVPPSNHREWEGGGSFDYNGLDRVNSNKGHIVNNVIPCCWICNRAKRERTMSQFIEHINRLINTKNQRMDLNKYRQLYTIIDITPLQDKKYRDIVYHRQIVDYDDGDLSLEEFYRLSQLNCYYCSLSPLKSNCFRKIFRYNGLDRLNSTLLHDFDNCITSCKYCNYGKQGLSLLEFDRWIERLETRKIEQGFEDLVMLSNFAA